MERAAIGSHSLKSVIENPKEATTKTKAKYGQAP